MAKVPYKNTVEAVNDLAEGRVHGYVAAYAILRPRIQAGKIKVLALTNPNPAASLPDIPTGAAAGFKTLTMDGLTGLFGPKGMPLPVRERIAKDIREVLADPAIAERLAVTGQIVNPGSPAEFAAAIADQRATVKQIGEVLELKPPQ
jgi:tripartite-type tricarboxylate transporter receptor subunit TctC